LKIYMLYKYNYIMKKTADSNYTTNSKLKVKENVTPVEEVCSHALRLLCILGPLNGRLDGPQRHSENGDGEKSPYPAGK
jgi:hypothetical protein